MPEAIDTSAEQAATNVEWDLQPLVDGGGAEGVRSILAEAQTEADAFAKEYEGTIADRSPDEIAALVKQLADLSERIGRAGSYAMLAFSADTEDPANGALVADIQERASRLESALLFFELEWAAIPDEQAEKALEHDDLAFARHHLRSIRRYRDHLLSPAEERLLAETGPTGSAAWSRLHGEILSRIRVPVPGEPEAEAEPLTVILNRLSSNDREHRKAVAEAVTESLEPDLKTRAFIFNTLLQDKSIGDRLRHYPHWLSSRNLSNEASDASVQALVTAVKERYEVGRRWYRLKAKLLGLDVLSDYDRVAVVTKDDARISWNDGRDLVLDSYRSFSPDLGTAAEHFFTDNYIDAAPRQGKRGGAFCAYTVPSRHPYILMSYTGSRRDVLTLAHELGHGVQASLARPRGPFEQHTPLTVAETASVFGETLVFDRLLEQTTTPEDRLSLLAENIEGAIATVFRQVAMNDFEHRIHTARREQGELSVETFNELWRASQTEFFGDSVNVSEGYDTWWSYVPHFVNTPGYVYAYAFGQLLALSIYKRYRDTGAGFVPDYLELLAAGGSRSPEELGEIVGVDLSDPGFWHAGLDLVEELELQAEEAAYAARPELKG
ncbi:MAG: M3 family oligoendopeptidase [Solirubrobacteraceae bacterium]|nr:M3 family oligoendopeptidase [Solirubrobacteraceae bacterium]